MTFPDSKVHGSNMGPTWVLSASDGPHVRPINLSIRVVQSPIAFLGELSQNPSFEFCALWNGKYFCIQIVLKKK